MEIKAILFDKDGTIIDFFEVWGKAVSPVIDRIIEHFQLSEIPDVKNRILHTLGIHNERIDAEGAFAWKSYEGIAKDIEEELRLENRFDKKELETVMSQYFFREIAEKRTEYPLFTDMQELMENLHNTGIQVGLATTDGYESTKICMQKIGIEQWISFYGTEDQGMPSKPDGELIHYAAKEWNLRPEEIAVVGDTPNDMRFARNGHAIGIAVLSGTGQEAELKPLADYVIESVDELFPLVNNINKKKES